MADLQNAGERGLPPGDSAALADHLVYLKHQSMYRWTEPWIQHREVLDLGCGEGYGSRILSAEAREVIAADYSPVAARHVQATYGNEHLHSVCCSGEQLPFASRSFDTVVSFEVVEHIPDVGRYLREVRRILRPGGTFLVSTPNRCLRFILFRRPWNHHHLREYTAQEYSQTLRSVFPQVEIRGVTASGQIIGIEKDRVRRAALKAYASRLARRFLPAFWFASLRSSVRAYQGGPVLRKGTTARKSGRLELEKRRFTEASFQFVDHNLDESLTLVAICTF